MEDEGERRVPAAELRELVTGIFLSCGMNEAGANLVADSLVYADLRGVHSHGVLRVPEYVKKLTQGGVNPRGEPQVVQDSGACMVVDGGNSMGQIGTHFAMQQAIERAATTGIAAVAIRGSNHCGTMAYFATQALPYDMIGWATTNALQTMAPWGGAERLLGINPLAIAIPAGQEPPVVYDAAFSASAHGKIRIYRQKGLKIPEGWALDRRGNPTIDPAAAIDGLLMPIGGFKGTGLAMIMGILSTMLSDASYGTELGNMEEGPHPGHDGHFVMAMRIAAFTAVDRFKHRVDQAIRQLHTCRKAPGFDYIYAPGEKEYRTEQDYRKNGILINPVTLGDIRLTAGTLEIDTGNYVWLA